MVGYFVHHALALRSLQGELNHPKQQPVEMDMDTPCATVIETLELQRTYSVGGEEVHALEGVSLTIGGGQFVGITGPSGSGKSTLLYLLGGLDHPTAGTIRVLGQEIANMDENKLAAFRSSLVGFVYQSFHLLPNMTAEQNVELPMVIRCLPIRERRKRAMQLLEQMGLGERLNHRPAQLSGGQQQRVALARALANRPRILLADEPTGNLDSRTGQEIIALFQQLCRDEGITVVMVSHDPAAVASTDYFFRLQDGRVISTGTGSTFGEPSDGRQAANAGVG